MAALFSLEKGPHFKCERRDYSPIISSSAVNLIHRFIVMAFVMILKRDEEASDFKVLLQRRSSAINFPFQWCHILHFTYVTYSMYQILPIAYIKYQVSARGKSRA